jgi:U3 small nucleolar RNA-associated protein 10
MSKKVTQLSRQLDRLADRDRGAVLKTVGLKSFLFDSREAAKYDTEAIHAIGINGLLELAAVDARFADFRDGVLFGAEARAVGPDQRTQQDLDAADEAIERLCDLLCAHFARRAAHKVVEWLVRGHKAYSRTRAVDALLAAALPYHDTAAFARLLPVLRLSGKWEFLREAARSGVSMARESYVAQCRADSALLVWTVTTARRAAGHGALSRAFACFVGAVCVQLVDPVAVGQAKVGNRLVTALLPLIVDGLSGDASGDSRGLQSLAYIVTSQLGSAAELTRATLSNILSLALRSYAELPEDSESARGCVLMVVHLCRSQRVYGRVVIPKTALASVLIAARRWRKELVAVSDELNYDVAALCEALVRLVLVHGISRENAEGEDNAAARERRETSWKMLVGVLQEVQLPANVAQSIAKRLLKTFVKGHAHKEETKKECKDCIRLKRALSVLAARYPD